MAAGPRAGGVASYSCLTLILTLSAHVTGDVPVVTKDPVHEVPRPGHGGRAAGYARLPRVQLQLLHVRCPVDRVISVLSPITHSSTPSSASRSGSNASPTSRVLRCVPASF